MLRSIFGLFVLRNLLLCGGNLWKSATFSVAPGFWGSFARLDFLVAAHKGLLLSSRNTDPPCTMASSIRYCPKLQKSFYHKIPYVQTQIQQTKMLVTCQRFGDLFLFGLIWQSSSNHKTYDKGRFKAIVTYLQQ